MRVAVRIQKLILLLAFTGLLSAAPLTIVNPIISDLEDAPALPPSFTFVPGQLIYLRFEIAGYKVSPEQQIKISYKVDAMDPKGVRLMDTVESNVDTALAEEDKNWRPKVRQQFMIPPLAVSGPYKIAIALKDDLASTTASSEIKFDVRGREVQPSDTLVLRNFHFYRGEDDNEPLAVSAYKPGNTLWARFDITGYKFAPHNGVDVDYGISVIAPSGKVLFTQEKAAEEKSSSFYPKAYIPGNMNLSLQNNIRPGQYTIVLTVRDHTGNQTYEAKENFTVE